MCEMHPGRMVEVCDEVVCGGCAEMAMMSEPFVPSKAVKLVPVPSGPHFSVRMVSEAEAVSFFSRHPEMVGKV